ncbi:hypothetical protein SAMN05216262_101143 [Colwellia chukchiensis]|uniref:DNA repair protein n=1 Tax=Colwellia chukchiensis TaxID=641665 RepID=A0A1H7GAN2_9GAMM|nr:hypothetical protein [Colwellia chukchiensis]SEK35323.1 hypothetical protein SAMN05216262_101143 [Colwellia chukchiensis]
MGIIIALIIALVIIVVVVNAIQQHKEKVAQEKRAKAAKQKAIIDETEELLVSLANLPNNPNLVKILNNRSLNAAIAMAKIFPENKLLTKRVQELQARLDASSNTSNSDTEQAFNLPDNEQHLVAILQSIKKLRATLKSEQSKGNLDAQSFTQEDHKLSAMQLKIGVESLQKRGMIAYQKEMLGSARQYLEKALQTIADSPLQTDYCSKKREEIESVLDGITSSLKNTNAKDAAKKAKAEEDDLDLLFQPKKKW